MIFEKVKTIIAEQLELDEDEVTLDAVVTDDLGADSIDIVDIVMALEDEFGVEIPDDAIDYIKSVGDIVKYIEDNQ